MCMQMTAEFGAVMQRPEIREQFDDELVLWSRAILQYCRATQTQCTAIKKILDETSCK